MTRRINENGLAIIKRFEGCRLESYKCPADKWTIGYGHTGDVYPGEKITQDQADAILSDDLARFEAGVEEVLCAAPTTSNQFSAFVSLAFNIGLGAFSRSSALRLHRTKLYGAAADAILLWNRAAGKVLPGLVKRREAERGLYMLPDNTQKG